jgi:hypothetical protein
VPTTAIFMARLKNIVGGLPFNPELQKKKFARLHIPSL